MSVSTGKLSGPREPKKRISQKCPQIVPFDLIDWSPEGPLCNTEVTVPYNHDLFESRIVKKRTKVDGVSNQEQWSSRGPNPEMRVALTAPKRLVISFIPRCQVKGWPLLCFRHSKLGAKNSTLLGKRWFGMRNIHGPTNAAYGVGNILQRKFPIPTHTSYGHETTTVEHLITYPSARTDQVSQPYSKKAHTVKRSTNSSASPWIASVVFNDCIPPLHFAGANCIPKDGINLVSSSKNTCALSSSKTRKMSSA
ncbi:hypothetical protein CSKR_102008 [Clonorchis sinensis]|uniref:Uncharacterized protein n=1 Tax=Clonorchis sinensis TaxID=79923 RepID=A0A3R7CN23_CLOSI|nr:hypothetical protein CSKR_102008 [Clonorchis sinensis]